MAKILLLSDMHLVSENPVGRLDDLTETQWEKLDFILNYAKENLIDLILQAGDLTDTKRSWAVLQRLTELLKKHGILFYFVKGQHDSYFRDMDNNKTTTGILMTAELIRKLTPEGEILEDVGLYGASYGEEVVQNPIRAYRRSILVIHAPISEKGGYGNDYLSAKAFLKKQKGYDMILCGDIHEKFLIEKDGRWICNTGPLLRMESSKDMFAHDPCFYVYDTAKNMVKTVPIPTLPAKQVLSRDHLDRQKQKQERFEDFIDRVQNASGVSSVDFMENLNMLINKNKTSANVIKIIHHYMEQERSDA